MDDFASLLLGALVALGIAVLAAILLITWRDRERERREQREADDAWDQWHRDRLRKNERNGKPPPVEADSDDYR